MWETSFLSTTSEMQLQSLMFPVLLFILVSSAFEDNQEVMNNPQEPVYVPQTREKPTLADLLTIEPSASIFYSYARELSLSGMFDDEKARVTLLVPTNKAVMALARKPHLGVRPGDINVSEEEFDRQSRRNVERWVSAHVIPQSPIAFESQTYPTLLHRKTITFTPVVKPVHEAPEWTSILVNGKARIIDMKEGSNGVIYLLDGTISLD